MEFQKEFWLDILWLMRSKASENTYGHLEKATLYLVEILEIVLSSLNGRLS